MGKELAKITKNSTKSVLDPGKMHINKDKPTTVVAPAEASTMPTPDDEAVAAARRRKAAEMQRRGGRASTILSEETKLGG